MQMDALVPAVARYLTYKLSIQGASEKTSYEYGIDLTNFLTYVYRKRNGIDHEESIDPSRISDEFIASIRAGDLYDYLLYTATVRQNKAPSRARKLSAIKGFFKFLVNTEKSLSDNPAKDVDAPQVKHPLPKFLNFEESKALLEAVRQNGGKNFRRDYCIITLFLNCGMRVSELCGISLSDLSKDLEQLVVTGKGNKQRLVYLNAACREALARYLEERQSISCRDPKALFVSRNSGRLSVKTVQWLVYKYLDLAGLGYKRFSVHKLRHTAATLMYESGQVDVRVLKDILGHEQLNTTQIYTHVSDAHMKEAMEKNPLSQIKNENT